MPEQLLHHFDVSSNELQQSRIRVPECVPSNALLQFGFPCGGANVVSHDCLGPKRVLTAGMRTSKEPVFAFAIRGLLAPRKQRLGQRAVKRHWLLRGLRLAGADNLVDDRASYAYMLGGEVDILPLQSEEFAAPRNGTQGHQHHRAFFDGEDG